MLQNHIFGIFATSARKYKTKLLELINNDKCLKEKEGRYFSEILIIECSREEEYVLIKY